MPKVEFSRAGMSYPSREDIASALRVPKLSLREGSQSRLEISRIGYCPELFRCENLSLIPRSEVISDPFALDRALDAKRNRARAILERGNFQRSSGCQNGCQ